MNIPVKPVSTVEQQGRFCFKTNRTLVSRLWRLFNSGQCSKSDARTEYTQRKYRFCFRNRLLQPLPILYEYLWIAYHSWTGACIRDGT